LNQGFFKNSGLRIVRGKVSLYLILTLIAISTLAGCGGPASKCLLSDERIGESYQYGMNYLEEKNSMLALGAFKSILACNNKFSPAYSGLAISYAQIAATGLNINGKTIGASSLALKRAEKYAANNEDIFRRHLAAMRAYTIYKSPGWFQKVESEYRLAMKARVDTHKLPYYDSSDVAGFYMGRAYFAVGRIESAMDEYEALSRADRSGKWGQLSQQALERSRLILSQINNSEAAPDVVVLTFSRTLKREDVAAILIGELKLDELLGYHETGPGRRGKTSPVDIKKSPFRDKIRKAVRLGIRGLEPSYSTGTSTYVFRPRKVVSRKEFAIIMDDILKRLSPFLPPMEERSGNFRGFADVAADAPWHKAVNNVMSLNLMKLSSQRRFRPDEGLEGTDAFIAVFALKRLLEP